MKYARLAEDLVFRGENGQYEALHDAFAVLKAQAYRILGYGITFFRLGYVV